MKLFDARLEAKNLRTRVAALEQELSAPAKKSLEMGDNNALEQPNPHVDFSNTVMVLKLVLERINAEFEVVQVDFEKEEIRDLSAPAGRQIIASGLRTRAFLKAYRTLLEQEGMQRGKK